MSGGRPFFLPSIEAAARWIGGRAMNVRRCALCNKERHVNLRTGKVNTDHSYKGVRFYLEKDTIWYDKIRQQ